MDEEIVSLLWALFVTGLVLVLAYWFTRHVVGRMSGSSMGRGRRISVVEQITIGKEQKLLLARMGERLYFLAVKPGGVTVLRELSEEEAVQWTAPESSVPPAGENFAQALRRVLEQRKK